MTDSQSAYRISLVQIDPLGFFSICWAIAHLFHYCNDFGANLGDILAIGFALTIIFKPRDLRYLALLAAVQVIDYLIGMPQSSNHFTIAFFVNVSILLAFFYSRRETGGLDREHIYASFSVFGRYALLIMYFYGIYHKINADFFYPDVSCASALWDAGMDRFGLAGVRFGHYLAIYSTFIIEALAIIFLFTRQLKYWGFLIGIPFHVFIGFTGYAFYMDFSTLCLALYGLFLPRAYFDSLGQFMTRLCQRFRVEPTTLTVFGVIVVAAIFAVLGFVADVNAPELYMPIFGFYSLFFYLSFVVWSWNEQFSSTAQFFRPSHAIFGLLAAAFFINGAMPYLGLKTESSIAMYSNLFTEGGRSNHYFHQRPLYIADYQSSLVEILESTDEGLHPYIGPNRYLTELEFERFLERRFRRGEKLEVMYRIGDAVYNFPVDPYDAKYSWLEKWLMEFKPVDFSQPKSCTH